MQHTRYVGGGAVCCKHTGTFVQAVALSLTFLSASPAAADTDIRTVLNDLLTAKQHVALSRTVTVEKRFCERGDPPARRVCFPVEIQEVENYTGPARVATPIVLSVSPVTFDKTKITQLPEKAQVSRGHFFNCAQATLTSAVGLSVSGSRGFSVSKSRGISSTTGVQLSGTFSVGVASTTLGISHSVTLSSSTSATESETVADTRTFSGSVSLQKGEGTDIELLAYQTTAEIPFSAKVVVDGDLEPNNSGFTKASQILSVQERTLPFEGAVRLSGLSEGYVTQRPTAVKVDCSGGNEQKTGELITHHQLALPLEPGYAKLFSSQKSMAQGKRVSPNLFSLMTNTFEPGDTIGPPDGTKYQIISTSTFTRMSPACGFNDLGLPNGGNFKSETRRYETWVNGALVAQWTDTVETFLGCASGP